MPSQISCDGTQQFAPSSMRPSQSSSRPLQISVFVPWTRNGSHTPALHLPATDAPAEFVTEHAVLSGWPLHTAVPASHVTPVPSTRHTLLPSTRHTPFSPLLQAAPLVGKSSSIFVSQSSSRLLQVSERSDLATICEIASSRPASSFA